VVLASQGALKVSGVEQVFKCALHGPPISFVLPRRTRGLLHLR